MTTTPDLTSPPDDLTRWCLDARYDIRRRVTDAKLRVSKWTPGPVPPVAVWP